MLRFSASPLFSSLAPTTAESLSVLDTMSTMSTTRRSSTPTPPPSPSLRRSAVTFLLRSPESPDSRSSGTLDSHRSVTHLLIWTCRDSEASAPAEYPPEQPEADLNPDGDQYGADEAEEEEEEAVEGEAAAADPDAMEQDSEIAGPDGEAAEESDEGSEDLEAESSGSEDEELEEEDGAGEEGDADTEMDGVEKPAAANGGAASHQADAIMAH